MSKTRQKKGDCWAGFPEDARKSIERPSLLPKLQAVSDKRKNEMPSNSKSLERFSYFPKDVTIAALVDVKSRRLPRKIQQELLGQATRQAGVVPFDWQMSGAEFVMYFGVDTVESALAAQKRFQQANFTVFFWTEEEGIYLAAKVLERLEREGVEVGPMIRVIEGLDGSPELETIEWRDFAKKCKYRN